MGRRRKRLIIQVDVTNEEDKALLAWILERRRKRRLADEIREGLRLRYRQQMGSSPPLAPALPPEPSQALQISVDERPKQKENGATKERLRALVEGF